MRMVLCAFVRDSDRAIARGSERERDKVVVVTRGGCAFENVHTCMPAIHVRRCVRIYK